MKKNFNPFKNLVLDKEEQEVEAFLEKGEYESSKNLDQVKKTFKKAVENYEKYIQTKPVTIRLNIVDLDTLRQKAKSLAIPYQTLIGALIRQYVSGKIKIEL